MDRLPTAERTIAQLFTDYHPWLLARVRRKLSSRADAGDIAAETFVQVVRHPDPGSIREPEAFLTVVAKRLVWRLLRRRDLEEAYLEHLRHHAPQAGPSAEERLVVIQTLQALDRWMQDLPAAVRLAFLFSAVDGMEHGEIARRLGVSVRTVGRYVERALLRCVAERACGAGR
ncbi:sigma-70 family RNA polymerase sigma factor [Xylophilus sp.]|uniref:sigma-70 family RNA polymerase sigma factor n=1 Tax=Xylophilus sp. TaxID=2653893 RepID=UPI0013BDA937|nr:sigma-70 family RNA polymerase sigma factor [Xylophilus sp.]KAF1050223.1 MAG: putative RNA polymerase sigma factor FecI [Xylophilus sp.]